MTNNLTPLLFTFMSHYGGQVNSLISQWAPVTD